MLKANDIIKNYDAVLFDMDGTLIDSMWIWDKVDIDFLNQRKLKLPKNLKIEIEGMSYYETAVYFKNKFNLEEEISEIIDIWNGMAYEQYANQVCIKQGAGDFIEYLSRNSIKTAICTSNSTYLTNAVMKRLEILSKINIVITSDHIKRGKPKPDIYLEAARILKVSPDRCLIFEDLPNGIKAGINAGMTTCTLDDDFSCSIIKEKKELADYYIHDYTELF